MVSKYRLSPNVVVSTMLALAIFCMLLLVACSEGPRPSSGERSAAMAMAPPPPVLDSMHVYDSTCSRLTRAFADRFDAGEGTPLLFAEQELTWQELASRVPADGAPYHGIMADYGLWNDSLRFGFSFFPMDTTASPDVFTFTLPDTLYDLQNGLLSPVDTLSWKENYQRNIENPSVYFSKVRVEHKAGAGFEPLDPVADAYADLMAWENELVVMHDENAAGHGDSTLYVVVRCIARPDATGDLRHRICYTLRLRAKGEPMGPYRDLLDNSHDPKYLLRMHGCDFGGLRPPGIASYTQPAR